MSKMSSSENIQDGEKGGATSCPADAACGQLAQGKMKRNSTRQRAQHVSYLSLFQESERIDYAVLSIGVLGAIASGATMPCFSLVFGEVCASPVPEYEHPTMCTTFIQEFCATVALCSSEHVAIRARKASQQVPRGRSSCDSALARSSSTHLENKM
jgi:hypothetical protein